MTQSHSIDKPHPKQSIALRLAGLLWLAGVLLWSSVEDQNLTWLMGLSLAGSAIAAGLIYHARKEHFLSRPAWLILLCAAAGLSVTVFALLLMALKTGLHGHSVPDFTSQQMINVFTRTFWWVLAGTVFGAGLAILQKTR